MLIKSVEAATGTEQRKDKLLELLKGRARVHRRGTTEHASVAIMTIFMGLAKRIKRRFRQPNKLHDCEDASGKKVDKWSGCRKEAASERHLQHLIYYANVNKWPEWS